MAKPKKQSSLGQSTREVLTSLNLMTEDELRQIEDGALTWTIAREPLSGIGGDEQIIQREIEEKKAAKRYVLQLRQAKSGKRVRSAIVEHEQGARLARAAEFDAAVAKRGGVASEIFAEGKPDDWTGIESEPTWDGYQWEFAQAAERLVSSGNDVPTLAFLFLCRQQVELALKSIIVRGRALLKVKASFPKTHSLEELWALALPIMKATWNEDEEWPAERVLQTARMVEEFHEIDHKSDFFRYPVDSEGRPIKVSPKLANFSPSAVWKAFENGMHVVHLSREWIELGIYLEDLDLKRASKKGR